MDNKGVIKTPLTYEQFLDKLFRKDLDLQLKTRIKNVLDFTRLDFITEAIKREAIEHDNIYLKEVAELSNEGFMNNFRGNAVSELGKGRQEGISAVISSNLGLRPNKDQDDQEFKSIVTRIKNNQ